MTSTPASPTTPAERASVLLDNLPPRPWTLRGTDSQTVLVAADGTVLATISGDSVFADCLSAVPEIVAAVTSTLTTARSHLAAVWAAVEAGGDVLEALNLLDAALADDS